MLIISGICPNNVSNYIIICPNNVNDWLYFRVDSCFTTGSEARRGKISLIWILIISAIFFILGAFNSKLLNPLNKIWYKFGIILGKIISPFIMGFIFYFIITPTGILMKVMKKDLLNLKFDKKEKSYWIKKSTIKSKMKNQF